MKAFLSVVYLQCFIQLMKILISKVYKTCEKLLKQSVVNQWNMSAIGSIFIFHC